MKRLYNDLWQTNLEHPFPDLNSHAYLLQRKQGNVLFYNTRYEQEIDYIDNLGGIDFQFLSHRHECGSSLAYIRQKFQSQLCVDKLERDYIEKFCPVDISCDSRQILSENIEVIPTPGHTCGGLCFYYQSPGGLNYLFTGDTLFPYHGRWSILPLVNEGGDSEKLIESLKSLRDLHPDVVLSSASVGDIAVVELTQAQWQQAIDENIYRLQN